MMVFEKIKTKFGEIKFFKTKEASFNIETINPKTRLPTGYLKNSKGILIMIEGNANSNKGKIKKGSVITIKPKEKFWLENKSNKKIKYLAIDIPPIKEKNIVWLE